MGSHAGSGTESGPLNDPDWGKVGIVLKGDMHHADNWFWEADTVPAKRQLSQLERLVIALKDKFKIRKLLLHSEVKGRRGSPTVCPGDSLGPEVVKLRKKLGMVGP